MEGPTVRTGPTGGEYGLVVHRGAGTKDRVLARPPIPADGTLVEPSRHDELSVGVEVWRHPGAFLLVTPTRLPSGFKERVGAVKDGTRRPA